MRSLFLLFLASQAALTESLKVAVLSGLDADTEGKESFSETNKALYLAAIPEAKKQGAEIIVFPEYGLGVDAEKANVEIGDTPKEDNPLQKALSDAAKESQIAVVAQVMLEDFSIAKDKKLIYLLAFDTAGALQTKHLKMHLWQSGEKKNAYGTGVTDIGLNVPFFEYNNVKIGLGVATDNLGHTPGSGCYPKRAKELKSQGAQVLLWSVGPMEKYTTCEKKEFKVHADHPTYLEGEVAKAKIPRPDFAAHGIIVDSNNKKVRHHVENRRSKVVQDGTKYTYPISAHYPELCVSDWLKKCQAESAKEAGIPIVLSAASGVGMHYSDEGSVLPPVYSEAAETTTGHSTGDLKLQIFEVSIPDRAGREDL